MLTTVLVSVALLLLLTLLPASSAARIQILVTDPEAGSIFAEESDFSADEQMQGLLVDLQSSAVLNEAARQADTSPDEVDVLTTYERDALVADVTVTAPSGAAARDIATAIPQIVADARRDQIRARSEEITTELRSQSEAALEQAVALEAELVPAFPPLDSAEVFLREQQRDALVARYGHLQTLAAETELQAPSRSVGFTAASEAELAPGGFPPPMTESVPLVVMIGLVAGVGLVIVRAVWGGHLQREHLGESGDRNLGLVRRTGDELDRDDLGSAAARLRTLPELRAPRSVLVSMMSLDTPMASMWMATSGLGRALAESGVDVAGLAVAYEFDAAPLDEGDVDSAMWIDIRELSSETSEAGRCQLLSAHRTHGSALAAAYSSDTRDVIDRHRGDHDVLLVDPTASGVEGWIEATLCPDLVVLVASEIETTHDRYEDARTRLAQAGIPAATLLLETPVAVSRRFSHDPESPEEFDAFGPRSREAGHGPT